jgi:phospholipase/carboxylesterase
MVWFRAWLDDLVPPARPVILVGFSGGAVFAGGLVLDQPARFAGAALLYGPLPFDAGVPTSPARLAGVPVVLVQGLNDRVIPRDLQNRTWDYLVGESGASATARRDPVGHEIAGPALHAVAGWLTERRAFLADRERPTANPT